MEKGCYTEWRYENICCWDKEVHGECLKSKFSPCDLYPRGLDGDGEHLSVEVWDFERSGSSRVELSFIGADGSLLYKQEVQDPQWEDSRNYSFLTLPPGPKFEDYIRTVNNKEMHKDVLILRLYMYDRKFKESGCTTIDVLERYVKVPALLFKDVQMEKSLKITGLEFQKGDECYDFDVCLAGSEQDVGEISINFTPLSGLENALIHACVTLLDSHDVVIKSKEAKHTFCDSKEWALQTTFQFEEVIENSFYMALCIKYVTKDTLHTDISSFNNLIEFSSIKPIFKTVKNGNLIDPVSSDSPSVTILLEELMGLYQDQDFSDFTLKCDNVTIPVHRNILSVRSPVFKSMLSCDMQEAATGCLDIVDMDPSTLARFLAFLYTGRVQDLQSDVALKLYYAADKYQVPTLKKECVDFLSANVSLSNVCEILSLADHHQDDQLTWVAHDFILKNYKGVLCSEEWKSFIVKEPLLGVKTLTHFVEGNRLREIDI